MNANTDILSLRIHAALDALRRGLPVIVADDPLTCVVRGSGMALEKMDQLGSIFTSE